METTSPVPHASTLNSEKAKVLAAWALARTTPFTIDDVELCLGLKLDLPRQGRSQVESFLAAHPSIVSLEELFFTPRILAMARSFRIRLLPEEHTGQFLVPGHRFLPFVPLDTPPDRIRVVNAQLVALPRRTVPVSAGLLRMAHAFLGTTEFCRLPPEQQVPASVFDLSGVPRGPKEQLAEDWLVTCHDFDALTFFLTPLTNTRAATATKKLNQGLRFAVRGRWRGPRTAPRQLLAAVACCWPEPRSTPIGPIGPALNNHRHVILAGPDGHPVLMEAPAGKAVAETEAPRKVVPDTPGEPPPEEMRRRLDHTLGDLSVRAQPQTAPFRGRFQKWQWDSQYENYFTVLRDPFSELEFDIHIDAEFNAITGVLNGFCSCTDADEDMAEHGGSCIHVLAAFIDLQASLSAARAVAPPEPPAPWRTLIDALDELSAQPAAQDQRLVWRLRLDTHDVELTAYEQKRLKSGGWSAGRQINLYRLQYLRDAWISAEDRQVAKLLEHRRVAGVLSQLAGHPRVFLTSDIDTPVTVEKAPLRLHVVERSGNLKILPSAGALTTRGDTRVHQLDENLVFVSPDRRRLVIAPIPPAAQRLVALLLSGDLDVPQEAIDVIDGRLARIETLLPVDRPASWAGERREADDRIFVRLTPDPAQGLAISLHVRPLPGAPQTFPPGTGPEEISGRIEGVRAHARRDLTREKERARRLADRLMLERFTPTGPGTWRVDQDDDALDFVEQLRTDAGEGVPVEWPADGRIRSVTRPATIKDLRVGLTQGRDWFGLGGSVEVDGETVALGELFQALRAGRRYVAVTGGKWLRIADELGARLRPLAHASHGARAHAELGPTAAPLVAELTREAGTVEACAAWRELEQRFTNAMAMNPELPPGFQAKLRPYQHEGYVWMRRLAAWGVGGCLADDMGLGKTVQALAVLCARAELGPALVVAPVSVGSNWLREARQFAPQLRPVLYRESDRDTERPVFGPGDLVITSYGLMLRDAARLAAVRWGTFLLDEAQFVKNSQTKSAQAVRQITADWRFALTGTPVENHLGDLWGLFRAVSPGLFGSWEEFRDRFAAPIERDRNAGRRDALARLVRPFVLRRTKSEVLKDLPARTEVRLTAELSPAERQLYEAARLQALEDLAHAGADGKEDPRFKVLAALTRLRQLACHPRLVFPDADAGSAKLQVLLDTVEELRDEGHRALVFSQFTSHLALVRAALDQRKVSYQYLDGSTSPARRDAAVAAFQSGEGDLFLISLKAGGTGLNLTAADYVIHLDPWWNPAVEDQATDRAHRIGQQRPVMVYRIVAAGTIEEQILALHADKRDLVAGVLAGSDQAGKLSTEDLISLIRGEA